MSSFELKTRYRSDLKALTKSRCVWLKCLICYIENELSYKPDIPTGLSLQYLRSFNIMGGLNGLNFASCQNECVQQLLAV